jgi:hypothetical protein
LVRLVSKSYSLVCVVEPLRNAPVPAEGAVRCAVEAA